MRIFVTGHVGKLGSRVTTRLLDSGHEVVGYDRAVHAQHDILHPAALNAAMQGCEVVVHTAAIPHPRKGDMARYFRVNGEGTLNVLEAARTNGVRRVVYTSSTGFYGCDIDGVLCPAYLPMDEAHPPAWVPGYGIGGLSAYNQSKAIAGALLAWYGSNHVMETVSLRIAPANTKAEQYKPGLDWRAYHDWRRGALFCNCHPDYAAEAIVRAALAPGALWGAVYNVVDQYTHRDIDARAFAREAFGLEMPDAWQDGESLITSARIQTDLGWQPCEERV